MFVVASTHILILIVVPITIILILSHLLILRTLLVVSCVVSFECGPAQLVQTQLVLRQVSLPKKSTNIAMVSDWGHDGCVDEKINCWCSVYAVFFFSIHVLVYVPLLSLVIATIILVSKVDVALKPLNTVVQAGVGLIQPVSGICRCFSLICLCAKLLHTIRRLCRVDGRLSRC